MISKRSVDVAAPPAAGGLVNSFVSFVGFVVHFDLVAPSGRMAAASPR